jgi:hypothetical protein
MGSTRFRQDHPIFDSIQRSLTAPVQCTLHRWPDRVLHFALGD